MNTILKNAYDLHVHTAPDVTNRKCTDLELAKRWLAAGMRGGVIKAHYADTSGRAALIRECFPQLDVRGGLALNCQAGGINPEAAERMAQAGGDFLWMPTMDSLSHQQHRQGNQLSPKNKYLKVLDEEGKLLPQTEEVLEIVKKYDLILCTGHLSANEGIQIIREASLKGIRRMLITHADNPANQYTVEQQKECVRAGAFIEHSFFTTFYNRCSWEQIVSEIKAVGSEHVILSTDFGQPKSPFSDEGMLQYSDGLIQHGILQSEIEAMITINPKLILRPLCKELL